MPLHEHDPGLPLINDEFYYSPIRESLMGAIPGYRNHIAQKGDR
jgi:hypothetical protein